VLSPQSTRTAALARLLAILLAISSLAFPLYLSSVVFGPHVRTPFRVQAFSDHTELVISGICSATALLAACTILRKRKIASILGIAYFSAITIHAILETILTYHSRQPFWGPRIGSIAESALMAVVLALMTWFFAFKYPTVVTDA
jgi:hypothetical protein